MQHISILKSPYPFAHCISADLVMKGLAREVKSWYPAAPSYNKFRYPPNIGSVLVYFDPYVFSSVTKIRFYNKRTYESVLSSDYELREIVISSGFQHLILPRLASGLNYLDLNIVFELICQLIDPIPITIQMI